MVIKCLHHQKRDLRSLCYRQNHRCHRLLTRHSYRRLLRFQRFRVHNSDKATKQYLPYINSSNMLSDSSVNWSSQHSQHISSKSSLSCLLIAFPQTLLFLVFFSSVTQISPITFNYRRGSHSRSTCISTTTVAK